MTSKRIIIIFCQVAVSSLLCCSCATSGLSKKGRHAIQGKTYVIIGASSGLGRGVAEKLGQYHANVVLAARRTALLEEVATEIKNAGGHAIVVTTDISNEKNVRHLCDTALKVLPYD